MKKIKWSILSLAFIFSICAAFATKPHFDCSTAPQFYFNGNVYVPVGLNYGCAQGVNACTYYTLNGGITYSPCTVGTYVNCMGCIVAPTTPTEPASNVGHSGGSPH